MPATLNLIDRVTALINESCDTSPRFQAALAAQNQRIAAGELAEQARIAAVKAAHPDAAARVAARRAARSAR